MTLKMRKSKRNNELRNNQNIGVEEVQAEGSSGDIHEPATAFGDLSARSLQMTPKHSC